MPVFLAVAARADDDDVATPPDPALLIPGLKVFAVMAALFIAAIVWYQMRKRAIVRAAKESEQKPS